jgi:branched-chain amino acid transport system permease protein
MRILVTAATCVVLLVCFVLLKQSRWGRALRAVAIDRETAATVGVPVKRYVAAVFVVGTALAGLGGALLLSLFPMSPFSGGSYTIKGFAVAIIGGLGSVSGAVIAAVLLGMIEAIASGYVSPAWANAYAFGAMIFILLVRPSGLRGGTH